MAQLLNWLRLSTVTGTPFICTGFRMAIRAFKKAVNYAWDNLGTMVLIPVAGVAVVGRSYSSLEAPMG